MTEENIILTEKNFKTETEEMFSSFRKITEYNEQEAPIIYNFISCDEVTIYIYKDRRKKLYKINASGIVHDASYMPFNYGKNYDTIWTTTDYTNAKKAFKWLAEHIAIKKEIYREDVMRKSIQNQDKRNSSECELWPLHELHN